MSPIARRCFIVIALALLATFSYAKQGTPESPLFLSSGLEGGGYWSAGERLREAAATLGLTVTNQPSAGSLQNMELLSSMESPVSLAFVQADAALQYIESHPGIEEQLEVLENIGQECVFILTRADSGLKNLSDLEKKAADLSLGINSPSSGMAATFSYLSEEISRLKKVEVVYGDTAGAVQGFVQGEGGLDAVMVVHRPKEHSPELDLAVANPERITMLPLDISRFKDTLPNGDPVYESSRIVVPGAKKPLKTLCVKGVLLANKIKLQMQPRNTLTDLVSYHWMKVYVTP